MKQFSLGTIVGAAIIFLCTRSCSKDVQTANRAAKDTIMVQDTAIIVKAKKDSTLAADTIRYLLSVVRRVQGHADKRETDLTNALAQSDFTIIKLRTASEGHDTVGYVQLCDTLRVQYQVAKTAGFAFKHERDSLLELWPRVHSVDSLALVNCYNSSSKKDKLFTNLSTLYDKTDALLTRATKKKFAAGPFIGVTYTTSFKPTYGIGISYQLFKF